MKSVDLLATVERWLDSGKAELLLQIDQQPLRIQRGTNGLIYTAPLSAAWRGDDESLAAALRLSGPRIRRFSAALALDPHSHRLCLVQFQSFQGTSAVISIIEALVNQRDVWESMLEAAASPVKRPVRPLSLGNSYV
uniref:HrpG n=1 Tax=Pseudomonas viridiflava TaxID=33069 RepID=B3IXJ6_PSEVI|nr:HrpG [Pseudomonas viridiflava]